MAFSDWTQIHAHILELEQEGLVTRTFRRLDPRRQQAVLNAILEEAIEKGPTSVNVRMIAERAEVSVGSLYTYFRKREGLLCFAVELCVRFIIDEFTAFRPLLSTMGLRDALEAYLTGGIEWSQTQMGLIQFFARAAYQGDPALADQVVRPIASTAREMVHHILSQAVTRGEIREDVDLEAMTGIVHALMLTVGDSILLPYLNAYFQIETPEVSRESTQEALVDLILHGIAAR
jgi:AcrR family transcriptional regulator